MPPNKLYSVGFGLVNGVVLERNSAYKRNNKLGYVLERIISSQQSNNKTAAESFQALL